MRTGFRNLEFHTSHADWRHPGVACIHHCLLRVDDSKDLMKILTEIGDTFPRFAYLETVVLETSRTLLADDVQPLLEALRKVCDGVEVQLRTADEAHKIALEAKESPSHSTSIGLLSPFWCVEGFVGIWDSW